MRFVIRATFWLFRALASRIVIVVFMLGLLIASHTVSFVASATMAALTTASRLVTSQPFRPYGVAALQAQNDQLRNEAAAQRRANDRLRNEAAAQRRAVNTKIQRIRTRTRQTALSNFAAMGGEALPVIGIGVIVAATAYELNMSCENMRDLYELQIELDPSFANSEDRDMVCGLQVPTRDELWQSIKASPGAVWDKAVGTAVETAEWARSLERPDFGAAWNRFVAYLSSWFD
jgi:cell division protein FtsB